MKKAVLKLCRNGIAHIAIAQLGSWFCLLGILRLRITPLYHKVLYHPVKQGAIIKTLFYQFYKITPVYGRFVIKPDNASAITGFYPYILMIEILSKRCSKGEK